jgi:16S rRNA G966 N2-methylase RsmD
MEQYFDITDNIDQNELQINEIGKYSISKPKHAELITHIIKKIYKNPKTVTITDATGNMGGNTISFAKTFKNVNSIEIVPEHCSMLQNNINVYNLTNVTVHCANYLDIMNNLNQNVVFIDAPWGGRNYKKQKQVKLYLYYNNNQKINIEHVVNNIKNTELIVLKVPYNFDFISFYRNIKYHKTITYNLKKFIVIVISSKS